jgi:hypothetical protein
VFVCCATSADEASNLHLIESFEVILLHDKDNVTVFQTHFVAEAQKWGGLSNTSAEGVEPLYSWPLSMLRYTEPVLLENF